MPVTILKLIWPFLEKYMAGHAADYLQGRREQRLGLFSEADDEPAESDTPQEKAGRQGNVAQALAFTTLGVAIGSGLGFVIGQRINQDK